jgi:hypothetical protein
MNINDLVGLLLEITTILGVPPVNDIPALIKLPRKEYKLQYGDSSAVYVRPLIYHSGGLTKSVLVHELTHHVQEMTGRYGTTLNCEVLVLREKEAREVQEKWADLNDVTNSVSYYHHNCNNSQ